MPSISLSDAVYRRLLGRAASFADTGEDVIRRLLDETEKADESGKKADDAKPGRSPRAVPGSILPEREYWCPILRIVSDAGGAAPANDVIDALGDRMRDLLTPRDFEVLQMGEVRWRNRARFARLRMRQHGLLSDESHRGIWEITDAGRLFLAENEDRAQDPLGKVR